MCAEHGEVKGRECWVEQSGLTPSLVLPLTRAAHCTVTNCTIQKYILTAYLLQLFQCDEHLLGQEAKYCLKLNKISRHDML